MCLSIICAYGNTFLPSCQEKYISFVNYLLGTNLQYRPSTDCETTKKGQTLTWEYLVNADRAGALFAMLTDTMLTATPLTQ